MTRSTTRPPPSRRTNAAWTSCPPPGHRSRRGTEAGVAGKFRRPSTPAQRAQAAAARDAKLAALHQALTEQVRALATGPAWRRWLDVAGRFHTYRTGGSGIFEPGECLPRPTGDGAGPAAGRSVTSTCGVAGPVAAGLAGPAHGGRRGQAEDAGDRRA